MSERDYQEQESDELTPLDVRLEARLNYCASYVAVMVWTIVICGCVVVFAFAGNPRLSLTWP